MYNELFLTWQYEIENEDLGSIAADFYSKISDYITYLKEENKKENTKTVKSSLLLHELNHRELL